jgi:Ca2+-transporting ATPase
VDEIPFDSDRKTMTTIHKNVMSSAGKIDYTKGAPDVVLKQCSRIRTGGKNLPLNDAVRKKITDTINTMSGEGLRVLAASTNQVFLGMVGMRDPARPESKKAVETFKKAGVRTVMITGDHAETAFAIGKQLGIAEDKAQCMTGAQMEMLDKEELADAVHDVRIFARVSPAQKVNIVEAFKRNGEIVAMTGDGINDAPSLKAADIGIAMGMNGTDVAKQAADMILTDDNFATIEKAIEEGRGVYENIRKSVIFLLSSNLGEILTMFAAVVCGLASPLKSSHILWINLITDTLPALALGVDVNNNKALMENKPRKSDESIFARGGLACTCFYGCLIAAISLAAFLMLPIAWLKSQGAAVNLTSLAAALGHEPIMEHSQTYAFTVLGMSQLFHAVGMRDTQRSVFRMNHMQNKLMIAACVIGLMLQLAVTKISVLTKAFGTARLSLKEWLILTVLASFPLIAHELIILFKYDGGKK